MWGKKQRESNLKLKNLELFYENLVAKLDIP
jgi:hypothetical protein